MNHSKFVEFEVYGKYALFSDPITRIGGEKCSFQIPTYEALKGIISSVYWKPTFIWYIDSVRIMNPIKMEAKGIRTIKMDSEKDSTDLSFYTYLRNPRYQVRAHFEWNENRPELAIDRDENKHYEIACRMVKKGGRRDVFLGTRECQGYVNPCVFGEGESAYKDDIGFSPMYHSLTYPDEAYNNSTKNMLTMNMWLPVMKDSVIDFIRPDECKIHKMVRKADMKIFSEGNRNFNLAE